MQFSEVAVDPRFRRCNQGRDSVEYHVNTKAGILVVVEPEHEPFVVLARAIWLAKIMKCKIQLLLCDPSANPLPISVIASDKSSAIEKVIRKAQKELAKKLASKAREAGVVVTTEIVEERPIAEAVLKRAKVSRPSFVMKGTQFHSAAQRSMLVDTDWFLARTCPFPLWFVKASRFEKPPVIVAAVDPMHSHDKPAILDNTIIQSAQMLSELLGGELHLFHSYQRLNEISAQAIREFKPVKLNIDEIDKKIKKEHRDALDALAKKYDIAKEYVHQLPGRTSDLLPSFVRNRNVQLVIMGALSRWRLKRMVIGSTAERVMDHLPCDILIVKPNS
jgi:universal stress protein E